MTDQNQPNGTYRDWIPDLTAKENHTSIIEAAVDYRGDITIALKDGSKVEGYIFTSAGTGDDLTISLYPKKSEETQTIKFNDIQEMVFNGRDMADGRSWESWVKKYEAKQTALAEGKEFSEDIEPKNTLEVTE